MDIKANRQIAEQSQNLDATVEAGTVDDNAAPINGCVASFFDNGGAPKKGGRQNETKHDRDLFFSGPVALAQKPLTFVGLW